MIEFKDVEIKFGHITQFSGLTLRIHPRETVVLIGPSGHGKSVLLKLMAGVLAPSSGEIFIEGKNLITTRGKEKETLLRKMGMLFQKNALFDSLTAADNIGFPLRETTDLNETEIQKRIDEFLTAVGLSQAHHLYPDEMSGGMQKRLGIARALALHPEIIYYDDPTAGLDPITSRQIIQLIQSLKQKLGSTVVAITNDMNRAYQMADRIMMVVDHELVVTGTSVETRMHQDPRVQQFIGGILSGPLTEIA